MNECNYIFFLFSSLHSCYHPLHSACDSNHFLRYGELQGLNKQETADRYGKEQVHEWRRSYDTPPPNGESLEMCAERAVAYFKEQVSITMFCLLYYSYCPLTLENVILKIEPQLQAGKNVMIAAHGNSLRSIIMYLDKLTSQEVSF